MTLLESLLVAVGLAMDAFAVSLGAAASNQDMGPRASFRLSFHFGLFQCLMPIAGWAGGVALAQAFSSVDHWLAFALLGFVGAKMVLSGLAGEERATAGNPSRGTTLVLLSIATSIDALAVGLSLALLDVSIWYPALVIGLVTGVLALAGVRLGRFAGRLFGRAMEAAGGLLLIAIGLRILVSHLASL